MYKSEKETYNSGIYGTYLRLVVDNPDDYFWLCNQLAKIYKMLGGSCIDNLRVCPTSNGEKTDSYKDSLLSGCCGFYDKRITNEYTGNSFWVGFNYGH
jgi:hypothetical protein